MIKKTVTYKTHFGTERTEDFYFNMGVREGSRFELKYGGLDEYVKLTTEASDTLAAYDLFEDMLLTAYGKRGEDEQFRKKHPVTGALYRYELEDSPALDEIILGFLKDPSSAYKFINELLPEHLRKQMAEMADSEGSDTSKDEISDEELLKMKPQDMTPQQMQRAYILKTAKENANG